MNELPSPIPAIYSHEINQPIPLYQGKLELDSGSNLQGQGMIVLNWYPLPAIFFRIDLNQPPLVNKPSTYTLSIPDHSAITKVNLRKVVMGDRTNYIEGSLEPYDIGTGDQLSYVIFHIVNFPLYTGTWIQSGNTSWAGRLTLISEQENWKVTIDAPCNRKDIHTALDSQGGYAITNTAKLERNNGEPFTSQQTDGILTALCYFLSFVAGRWVSPILPVGFDDNNNKVWEKWFYYKLTPYQLTKSNWFPRYESENLISQHLSTAFNGFLTKYLKPVWQEPIKLSIYLYVESNNSGVEQAIITIQTVFELLFWVVAEQDKSFSKEIPKQINAPKKLKALFSHLQIPLELPEPTTQYRIEELTKLSKSDSDLSAAPACLVAVRNKIVHYKDKTDNKSNEILQYSNSRIFIEATLLSLWYLELALLKIFKYEGAYTNRLRKNRMDMDYDRLPWAK